MSFYANIRPIFIGWETFIHGRERAVILMEATSRPVDHGGNFTFHKTCLINKDGPIIISGDPWILSHLGESDVLGELDL
jgi:hypothetical protein